jgi:hypothetical protein
VNGNNDAGYAGCDVMANSIAKKSVYDTDPINEVIGGDAAWDDLALEDPDAVNVVAKSAARA